VLKQKKTVAIAMMAALLMGIIASTGNFFSRAEAVRGEVLRLHVLANSDSDEDQALKLRVRDAILQAGSSLFDGTANIDNVREKLTQNQAALQSAGETVIHESGKDYTLSVFVTDEYFNTRTYGDVTLPAGRYTAVKAVIGKGAGHNWWCVMFPPLCLPAAQAEPEEYFDSGSLELVESDPKIEVRFKLLEWVESLRVRWFS
jgi:stage II sporulation protein R